MLKDFYFWVVVVLSKIFKQPIKRISFRGNLEPTNEYYAIAKIAGIKLCQARKQYKFDAICLMPTIYTVRGNYDYKNSHVLPALIKNFMKQRLKNWI